MDRLVVPAPEVPVLRLPWPGEARLTLPEIQPLRLILPGDLVPVVPGVAAGSVTGTATVSGVATHVTTSAAGSIEGTGYVVQATASVVAKAAGAVTGEATVSGTAVVPAAGSIVGEATITGTAIAVLAGTITGAGTVSGTAAAVLAGSVTAAGSVTGTAVARAVASGAITGTASITGTAVRATVPMGMDKSGTQSIPGGTWTQINTWTVRSGYPDTDISGNAMALKAGPYTSIAFTATIENSRQMALRIMKNGTTQLASSDSGSNVLAWTVTATSVTINNGDLITFEANPTASRVIQSGASNTYAIATPA